MAGFAHYFHDLSPFLVELGGGIGVRWYGLAYLGAFAAAWAVLVHFSRAGLCEIPPRRVGDFVMWLGLVGVILGGRLGYMLLYDFRSWMADPVLIFRIWDGGMASHGGIAGVALFTLWYARRHRIGWRNLGDSLVVAAPPGIVFGRLANFINGELYGRPSDVPWAVRFPQELRSLPPGEISEIVLRATTENPAWNSPAAIEVAARSHPQLQAILTEYLPPRHPSQIYEALLEGGVLFAVLWILRTRMRLHDGVVTGWFFIGYALLRIAGEFFREPDAPLTGLLTRGQFLSLFLILTGLAFLWSARRFPRYAPIWRIHASDS